MKQNEALKLALEAAEIGLTNLTSYQSTGKSPTIHEYGQAARALAKVRKVKEALAQEQERKPLTDKRITKVISQMPNGINGWMSDWDLYEYTRAVEAAHGIKGDE